jgi:hypothetical protein
MTQAELFAQVMQLADSVINDDEHLSAEALDAHWSRYGDSFGVARVEFKATLVNVEPYPGTEGDIMTTWKFPDESIVFILGDTDEQGQPNAGCVVLLPGQSEIDVARAAGLDVDTTDIVN